MRKYYERLLLQQPTNQIAWRCIICTHNVVCVRIRSRYAGLAYQASSIWGPTILSPLVGAATIGDGADERDATGRDGTGQLWLEPQPHVRGRKSRMPTARSRSRLASPACAGADHYPGLPARSGTRPAPPARKRPSLAHKISGTHPPAHLPGRELSSQPYGPHVWSPGRASCCAGPRQEFVPRTTGLLF